MQTSRAIKTTNSHIFVISFRRRRMQPLAGGLYRPTARPSMAGYQLVHLFRREQHRKCGRVPITHAESQRQGVLCKTVRRSRPGLPHGFCREASLCRRVAPKFERKCHLLHGRLYIGWVRIRNVRQRTPMAHQRASSTGRARASQARKKHLQWLNTAKDRMDGQMQSRRCDEQCVSRRSVARFVHSRVLFLSFHPTNTSSRRIRIVRIVIETIHFCEINTQMLFCSWC